MTPYEANHERFDPLYKLMADAMVEWPAWTINISLWNGVDHGRDVELIVPAPTGREALVKAISVLALRDGELFHTVHIGKAI